MHLLPQVNGETKKSKAKVTIAITSFTRIGQYPAKKMRNRSLSLAHFDDNFCTS